MATTTLPFSVASSSPTLCRFTQRETSSLPLSLSKPTSLALLTRPTLSPPPSPSTYCLFASHRRPFPCPSISTARPAFSTVARFSESEAPPVAVDDDPPTEVGLATVESPPTEESSEAAQVALPAPKREEIFAVVMVGSRQYIVFPGRWIITQRLKGANVNDKIILNKVLLVGTKTCSYIGKPVVTNAAVHAVVEEQMLDKKVIVFKYKKKKNYRRNIGHRQPITRIRITGITGYEDYPASYYPTS